MLYGRLVHEGEPLRDLQILSCKLHKNAFGCRASPGPAGSYRAPQTSYQLQGGGREGSGRKGLGIGREGREEGKMT